MEEFSEPPAVKPAFDLLSLNGDFLNFSVEPIELLNTLIYRVPYAFKVLVNQSIALPFTPFSYIG